MKPYFLYFCITFLLSFKAASTKHLRHDDIFTDDGLTFLDVQKSRPRIDDSVLVEEHTLTLPRAENETVAND